MTKEQKEQLERQKLRYEFRNYSKNELIALVSRVADMVLLWKLISIALFILLIISLVIL